MSETPAPLPPIQLRQEDHRGAWIIERDGKQLAELAYTQAGPDLIILEHTQVDDSLRGTGAGKKLVHEAVRWVRTNGIRIMPLCPFARSVFDKEPELGDVLMK